MKDHSQLPLMDHIVIILQTQIMKKTQVFQKSHERETYSQKKE